MPKHIALLGAGFSCNWGGLSSKRLFDHLLGSPEVTQGPCASELKYLLWKNKEAGFEVALDELQKAVDLQRKENATQQLRELVSAIERVFTVMHDGYAVRDWQFCNNRIFHPNRFLAQFDEIYTLNQDLLLEMKYLNASPELEWPGKWDGACLPGVKAPYGIDIGKDYRSFISYPMPQSEFCFYPRIQPVMKLHGSVNWKESNGSPLAVIGGRKSAAIERSPLLLKYHEKFCETLEREPVKVMAIGYSFGDEHINRYIANAAAKNDVRLFIVNPLAYKEYEKAPSLKPVRIIGVSQEPLSRTLAGDITELKNLEGFFS